MYAHHIGNYSHIFIKVAAKIILLIVAVIHTYSHEKLSHHNHSMPY